MSNKKIGIIGLIVALFVFGGYLVMSKVGDSNTSTGQSGSVLDTEETEESAADAEEDLTEEPTTDSYTLAEVATHKSADDCWTVINDKVYDLTDYIEEHNGGSVITQACGIDGSSLFNQRETSSGQSVGSGSPHSSSAQSELEDLEVGTLKK